MNKQELIDEILDNFDFESVFKVTQLLINKYRYESIADLRKMARKLLNSASNQKEFPTIESGGFCAQIKYLENDEVELRLFFYVAEWEESATIKEFEA